MLQNYSNTKEMPLTNEAHARENEISLTQYSPSPSATKRKDAFKTITEFLLDVVNTEGKGYNTMLFQKAEKFNAFTEPYLEVIGDIANMAVDCSDSYAHEAMNKIRHLEMMGDISKNA